MKGKTTLSKITKGKMTVSKAKMTTTEYIVIDLASSHLKKEKMSLIHLMMRMLR